MRVREREEEREGGRERNETMNIIHCWFIAILHYTCTCISGICECSNLVQVAKQPHSRGV